MGSLAALVFIAAAAAGGIYIGTQKTVIKGDVMAANMMEEVREKSGNAISKIVCDDRIPVGPSGAVFTCKFHGTDGSTAKFQYTMNRSGGLSANMLDSTGPSLERERPEPGTDGWK